MLKIILSVLMLGSFSFAQEGELEGKCYKDGVETKEVTVEEYSQAVEEILSAGFMGSDVSKVCQKYEAKYQGVTCEVMDEGEPLTLPTIADFCSAPPDEE